VVWQDHHPRRTPDSVYAECRGVIIPTPLVDFFGRSLYCARIAFLWEAMAIWKNEIHSAISTPIGLKFCIRLEGDNAHNRARRNSEFPPLKNWRPFEFCVCITANGSKNFKPALLEFPKLFSADIFRRTSPKARKLILTFLRK